MLRQLSKTIDSTVSKPLYCVALGANAIQRDDLTLFLTVIAEAQFSPPIFTVMKSWVRFLLCERRGDHRPVDDLFESLDAGKYYIEWALRFVRAINRSPA